MHRRVAFLAVLALTLTSFCRGAAPENLSIHYYHWTTSPFTAPAYLANLGPPQAGVWVAVFLSDPEVAAVSITLNYKTEAGEHFSRTELVPRAYRDVAAWTNYLFIVGKVKVESILAAPLVPGKSTKLVTAE